MIITNLTSKLSILDHVDQFIYQDRKTDTPQPDEFDVDETAEIVSDNSNNSLVDLLKKLQ